MDISGMLHDLRVQRHQLQRVIDELEALQSDSPVKRRGRKFMSAEERQQVSVRMHRYWATRRRAS